MNIGIDIDGVLADIVPYVFEYGSKLLYDKGRSLEDIDREKYETYEIFKWNRDDEHEFWDKYMFNYYTKAPARIFASEVIKKLKEDGHNIYIITDIIVFDCIYNKNIKNHQRVNSWYEILYLIENNKIGEKK